MTEFEKELNNTDATELATTDTQRVEDIQSRWRRNQAQMTLWANRQISPAAEAATLKYAEKLGITPKFVRRMDNRDLEKIDASEFSPEAQELIIQNPSLGIFFRDSAKRFNAVLDSLYYGSVPAEERKRRTEEGIRQNGYSAEQIADLKRAGYQQDAEGKWYIEKKEAPDAAETMLGYPAGDHFRREYVGTPVLKEWYLGPTERAAAAGEAVLDVLKSGNVRDVDEYSDISGRDLTRALLNDITLVGLLRARYGDVWQDYSDGDLRDAVKELADKYNKKMGVQTLSVDNLDLSRLRPRTMSENTEFLRKMGNAFGVPKLLAKAVRGAPTREQLAWIANNIGQATDEQIAFLNEHLLEVHRGTRGASMGVQWFEGAADVLRFVGEMYMTRGLVKGGETGVAAAAPLWKRLLGKAGMAFLEEGVRTVGAYAPGIIAEELMEPDNLQLGFNAAGEMEAALTPKVAGEMAENIFNKLLDQYIENVSERAGNVFNLIPAGKIISAAVPDKFKNAVVAKVVTDAYGKLTKAQWLTTVKEINKVANLNGAVPEILEEKLGDLFRTASTAFARDMNTNLGDLGQDYWFGSVAEELNMMAQVGSHTLLLRAPATVGDFIERRRLANFVDLQRAVKDQVVDLEEFSKSEQAVKAFYLQTGLPQAAHITPEKLHEITDSEKGGEVLEALGISESQIAEAEVNREILVVNLADAMAKLDPEVHGELMKRVTQFSSASVETVSDWDDAVTQKAVDARIQEADDFVKAYDNAIVELTALDLPDRTIRAASKIFGNFAHYFGRESGITGAEWIRTVGFEMMKKEDWDKQVRQALYQVSPVWTGSAANYERPSLLYIGTGEGAQVFGWGLYGSSSEKVARWYADMDVTRKRLLLDDAMQRPFEYDISGVKYMLRIKGEVVNSYNWRNFRDYTDAGMVEHMMGMGKSLEDAKELVAHAYKNDMNYAKRNLERAVERNRTSEAEGYRKEIEDLQGKIDRVNEIEYVPYEAPPKLDPADIMHNIYKQTFWHDKQEDLLDWDEMLTQAQVEKIMAQVEKDPRFEKEDYEKAKAERGHYTDVEPDKYYVWEYDEDGNKTAGHGFSRSWLEQYADPEKEWATAGDFYEQLAYTLGSPKAASEFLYAAGIDGVTYIGDSSGVRNYVAFSDTDIRIDEHIMYQTGRVKKGATSYNPVIDTMSFNDTWQATITLFEGAADASTLIHEIEHYAHHMMELLVEAGMASERMQEDLAKLKEWGTLTPEAAQKGYEEYVAELKADDPEAIPESFEFWKDSQYHENVAKALEAFVMGEKAPSSELIGAFAHLKNILKGIYRVVEALEVNLNDDVRSVFRGMMATEETIEREDIMRDVISAINDSGVLGLNQQGINSFKRLVALRNDQMEAELEAERAEKVKELKKQWKAEAQQLIDEDRAMSTWQAIVKYGGMNYKAVEEIAGKAAADELLARGLLREVKKSVTKGGTHPATFAANHGYASVDEMLMDLLDAQDPKQFMGEFLRDSEERFNAEFAMTENAMTVKATSDMLDALVTDLESLSGKEGKALRKEELRARVEAEIDGKKVLWVRSDTSLVKEVKDVANNLTKAISKQDYDTALKEAIALQKKLALAKAKAEGAKFIRKFERNLRKGLAVKKGRMDGHYQDALRDLSRRLGLSEPSRKKLTATVSDVIKAYNAQNPMAEMYLPPEAESGDHPVNDLTLAQLRDIFNVVEFLRGEGRELVREDKENRWDAIREDTAAVVEALRKNKKFDFKEDNMLVQAVSWAVTLESKLRNIIGWADNWDPEGVLTKTLYEPIMKAGSYASQMANTPSRAVTDAMNQLAKNSSKWDLASIRDIKFPEELRRRLGEYAKWDVKKVLMACLNMGNAMNRQRLIDGYEWGQNGESYCNRIAGLLSEADWALVQQIWDAVNDGGLVDRLKEVFYKIYHYDMTVEEPLAFGVNTSDGKAIRVKGGYMPLRYATSKSPKTKDEEIGKGKDGAPAEYRRPGFSHDRVKDFSAPLDISDATLPVQHIMDVAHYVTHVEAVRAIMPIIRSAEFRDEFVVKNGKPRYQMLVKLMENVASPNEWMKGNVTWLEKKMRAVKISSALFGSLSTAIKQPVSLFTGVDELGGHYVTALWAFNTHMMSTLDFVKSKSGFMAGRIGTPELDMKLLEKGDSFGGIQRFTKPLKKAGFAFTTAIDTWVVVPQWLAAYNKALKEGKQDRDAIAIADEFVAKTQGGNRPIDLSPSDLSALARCVMMFHTAASAAATTVVRTVGKIVYKRYDAPSLVMAVAGNIVFPLIAEAFATWLTRGRDDEDDFESVYWKYLGQSIASFTDLTDAAWKTLNGEYIEITALTPLKQLGKPVAELAKMAQGEGDFPRLMYHVAELAFAWMEVPVVTAYDRIIRQVEDWEGDDTVLDFKEHIGLKKPLKK